MVSRGQGQSWREVTVCENPREELESKVSIKGLGLEINLKPRKWGLETFKGSGCSYRGPGSRSMESNALFWPQQVLHVYTFMSTSKALIHIT